MGISIREFARRDGCDERLVRRAIGEGRLRKLPDGTLDEAMVGTGWRASNMTRQQVIVEVQGLPEDEVPELAASLARKEYALARLRELEYAQKSRLVAPIADMTALVAAQLAKVRTRLLAIPSETAAAVARCKTAAEAEAIIRRKVVEALAELSGADKV